MIRQTYFNELLARFELADRRKAAEEAYEPKWLELRASKVQKPAKVKLEASLPLDSELLTAALIGEEGVNIRDFLLSVEVTGVLDGETIEPEEPVKFTWQVT